MVIPKYRKPVLRGDIAYEVRRLIREICRRMDIEIISGHIPPDHFYLLLDVPRVRQVEAQLHGEAAVVGADPAETLVREAADRFGEQGSIKSAAECLR